MHTKLSEPTPSLHSGWQLGGYAIAAGVVILGLIGFVFSDGISELLRLWGAKEEYSHAYLIPVISGFLAWQKKNELAQLPWRGSWLSVGACAVGLLIFFAGSLSTIYAVIHYALIMTFAGAVIAVTGLPSVRYLWPALAYLIFMVPLPQFLYQALSTNLQLLSSEIGVAVIRMFGISVFLEGNVIDLGSYKLQVVEACNGLRYLFPLLSFGFLCAYLYRGPFWHRAVLLASTVPITVFMNSFRIGVIGYTVDHWGQDMAEGFLHDFEGWAIFMACLAVLFAEIAIFARLQRPSKTLADAFYVEIPASIPRESSRVRALPKQFYAVTALLCFGAILSFSIVKREEIIPPRDSFALFPTQLGEWVGTTDTLEQIYLDALKLTDYAMINYARGDNHAGVNFYTAYYESQRAGESAHSPRSCIPGGGWKIESISRVSLDTGNGRAHPANRVQIAMGENKQLVYYWFQQRGRIITNEYLVKWYLFVDALRRNRSDGALVRLTTQVLPDEDWADGDRRLNEFATALEDTLTQYVPD
jgi:exosortase D (VPLPA-CTERM-specific)